MPEPISFSVSDLLTVAGLFSALLAALYARRSAKEAARQAAAAESSVREAKAQSALAMDALYEARSQNKIAIHERQLESYKAVLQFKSKIIGGGINFKDDAIWILWDHVHLAEFYFPPNIAKNMERLVNQALEVQASRSLWADGAEVETGQRAGYVKKSNEKFMNLVGIFDQLEPEMRDELRIARPKT